MFLRPQFVPFIVVLEVIEGNPAEAIKAAGTMLSKLSIGLSVLLFPLSVWYKWFSIDAAVEVASEVVVVVAAVDELEENTDKIEDIVEGVSVFSAESNESFTSPGNCCNLANIEDWDEVANVSGVASTKSPTVLLTMRFKMLESGASTLVPSPTFKLELMGSIWLSGSK